MMRAQLLPLVLSLLLCTASMSVAADIERFLDSDEAKEREYRQGCAITDYSDLVSAEAVDWAWVQSSSRVGAPGALELKPLRNYSDVTEPEIAAKVEKRFRQAFERIGKSSGKGGLVATACIYWMQRFDSSKAPIPFAGPFMMQAGIGIELAVTDAGGRVLAKVRDNGRQGKDPDEAAAFVVDRIVNYLRDH